MTDLSRYYVSRAFVSLAFGALFALSISPWWLGALSGLLVFGFFFWAPHSGRYTVQPERGATAMQRDERALAISGQAARNGFVVTVMAIAAIALYFGAVTQTAVPILALHLTLALATFTYFLSDFWMRRS